MAGTFRQRDTRTHTEDVLGALTEASVSAGSVCAWGGCGLWRSGHGLKGWHFSLFLNNEQEAAIASGLRSSSDVSG